MSEKNIVLSLDSGTNFPIRPGSKLEISAKLDNVVLQTDQFKLHSDKNPLIECELVWETSKALLTALRTKRACVRVDVFIDQKLLGYLVLDVRSSPVVSGEDDPPLPQAHLLQGAGGMKPAPVLHAVLYIETEQGSPAAKPSKQINSIESLQKRVIKDPLKPVLVQDKGYFQIGESLNSRLFHLKVAVLRTENLHMLLPDLEKKEQEFKIVYDLLGTELHASPGEIATAKLNASKSSLISFLSSYGIQMNIVTQDKVIGTADIDVSNKLRIESQGFPVQYSGDCPVIASYNMATPRDKDGHYPYLTIFLHLDKLAHNPSPTAIDHQSIDLSHISEGELSEVISEEMNRGTPQQISPQKPPAKAPSNKPIESEVGVESESAFRRIDDTVDNIAAADDSRNSESRPIPQFLPESNADVIREDVLSVPLSPPTKLPRESSIHHKPQRQSSNHPSGNLKVLSSQPIGHQKVAQSLPPASGNLKETSNVLCDTRESSILPGDETDYKSPPSTRASSNQNTFEFGPDVKLPRKMIICVESVRMLHNYTDLVLWYEYPHLSSSRISTEPMKAGAGDRVSILDASVEYNFLSTQVQLTAVFTEYKLKIFVTSSRGDSTQQVGVGSVGIDQVLHVQPDRNGIKRKSLEVTIVSDKGVVGYLNLALSLQTFSPRQSPSSRKSLEHSLSFGSNSSINVSKNTVAENNRNKKPLQSKENVFNNQGQNSLPQQIKKGNLKEQNTYSNNRQVKDRLLEMEMLAQVAKELETWKINEQKKFKDELSKKECQQMSLLGREWQDREKERVEQYNTKLQMLQQREELLEKKLEQTEVKEKETTELKKSLEEEQTKLKQGKVDTIQKLRKEIKTKETEISQKDSELQVLKAKLNSTEEEFSKLKSEKEKKKDTQASLQVELRRSADEVIKLQTQLEIRTKELELMESQKDSLYKENQDLKAEQQNRMEELLSHLKLNKNMLEPSQINTGQLHPNASTSPSPRPSSSVRSGGGVGTSRSSASKTPDTQVELMPQQRTSSLYPSSSGKDQSTSPRDVKDTPREAKDTPREVKVLKDIRRMERDRDMMLRAGYLQDDDVIRMFEEKIAALYQGIRDEAEEID